MIDEGDHHMAGGHLEERSIYVQAKKLSRASLYTGRMRLPAVVFTSADMPSGHGSLCRLSCHAYRDRSEFRRRSSLLSEPRS